MPPTIECHSGTFFEFLDPKPEQVNINDIAHSLSMQCRFVGHSSRFYSVAEHSWHVARMLSGTPLSVQLGGLLHDASESYITDVPSPIKRHLANYEDIEDKIQAAVFERYDLEFPMHPAIKLADRAMLSIEAHYLLPSRGNGWDMWRHYKRAGIQDAYRPVGMGPDQAKECFLDKFTELLTEIRLEKKKNNG